MRHRATEEEGRESLVVHAADRAREARAAHGGPGAGLGMAALGALLEDRRFVRYPVTLDHDGTRLGAGELAHPEPLEEGNPAAGFVMHVHPRFADREEVVPLVVAYQLVRVNYGEIAGHEAAEVFGAILCGMGTEEYYRELCRLADSLPETL